MPFAGPPSPVVTQYTIDARSRKDWVYFNFARGTAVSTSQHALDWDLALRRTDLLTNSGDTNSRGQGGAVDLDEVPLDEASESRAASRRGRGAPGHAAT